MSVYMYSLNIEYLWDDKHYVLLTGFTTMCNIKLQGLFFSLELFIKEPAALNCFYKGARSMFYTWSRKYYSSTFSPRKNKDQI